MLERKYWLSKEVLLGFFLTVLIIAPIVALGGSTQIYVDKDAKGSEDGSSKHPYRTIARALKHAKEGTDIHIAKGTYKENITIPKGVKLFGRKKDRNDVIIKADKDDEPTIAMKHKTEINFLTVSGGRHGVRVLEDAKVKLYKVKIKNSDRDGVHLDSASRENKYRALLDDVEIYGSKRAGVFSEKRDIVMINSDVHDNGSDGIDLAAGMEAWLENNRIQRNGGSGLKVVLDDSAVWTKSNSIRHNKREGVEVNAYGKAGHFGLKKSTLISNSRYGVARVARTQSGLQSFGNIEFGTGINGNRMESNGVGSVSPALRGF